MTCQKCGRAAENGTPTHWLGCEETGLLNEVGGFTEEEQAAFKEAAAHCEHEGCSEPKKEWSGKGARPKYCAAGHKKEK